MTQYVLYDEELGVYLGSFLGLGFWSKLDPVGQDSACCFETIEQLYECVSGWDRLGPDGELNQTDRILRQARPVAVEVPDGAMWAPMGTCVAAGLPAWNYMTSRNSTAVSN